MIRMLKKWYGERFSDPQKITLIAIIIFLFSIVYFFNQLLMPILIAVVFAYLLELPTQFLVKSLKVPRLLAVIFILGCFIVLSLVVLSLLIPALWTQAFNFIKDLPVMFSNINNWVNGLPEVYPEYISTKMIDEVNINIQNTILAYGNSLVNFSVNSIVSLVTLGIYSFLVPFMVFFLLKDKDHFLSIGAQLLPQNRTLALGVWREMQQQIANYIRGKIIEIIIVGVVTYGILLFFGLNYPLLLAVAAGFSVLVPYIGAVLVTIPIAMVGFLQFGLSSDFYYLLIAFIISQLIDGNLIVPLLFSDAVNLHPLTIIVAVIVFGGIWGLWGVFFAIPLATLIKAIVNAFATKNIVE